MIHFKQSSSISSIKATNEEKKQRKDSEANNPESDPFQRHHRVIQVKQDPRRSLVQFLCSNQSAIRLHKAPQGLTWAVHRIIKASPPWQAPHHNCSTLPTSVFYPQAQNRVQHPWCDLGIPVQGSSCFTWPSAILLAMQPQRTSAVCFKGTLPARGQFTCWDLWEISVKTQEKQVLQTWSAWGLLICVKAFKLSCSATGQHFPCLFFYCPSSSRRLPCCLQHPFPLSTPSELWLS